MKHTVKFILPMLVALLVAPIFAKDAEGEEKSKWSGAITFDFVYYPKADFVAGKTHFAPSTGAFDSIEMRLTGDVTYTVPLWNHKWFGDATLAFTSSLELTPITVMPKFKMTFTPLPFLVFDAGVNIGTGWPVDSKMMQIDGLALLDPLAVYDGNVSSFDSYNALTPFNHFYIDPYLKGTFQFDLAALPPLKSDWTHVVMQVSYKTGFISLTGVPNKTVWKWQGGGNKTNGWQYEANFVIGYQMPLPLSMVGLMFDLSGHYSSADYERPEYKGNFMKADIAPLFRFTFAEHHVLTFLTQFSSRRSFVEEHKRSHQETALTYSGREWFFNRFILSYSYKF